MATERSLPEPTETSILLAIAATQKLSDSVEALEDK